jgi:hypothetical protein
MLERAIKAIKSVGERFAVMAKSEGNEPGGLVADPGPDAS